MKTRDFTSTVDAIREARVGGYWPRHRRDGVMVVSNGKRELVLQRETRPRSIVWHWSAGVPAEKTQEVA